MVDKPVPEESKGRHPSPESRAGEERRGPAPLGLLVGGLSLALTSMVKTFDRAATAGGDRRAASASEVTEASRSQPTPADLIEGQAATEGRAPRPGESGAGPTAHPVPPSETPSSGPVTPREAGESGVPTESSSEHSVDLIRAGLVGLILESEKQATRAVNVLNRGIQETADLVPGSRLPGSRRVRDALAREATKMEARGRAEVDRLAAIGAAEEAQASLAMEAAVRDLADKMVDEAVSLAIERIANSPEIHQVIRSESAGLFEDFLGRIRAVCARADELGERGARRVFRRGRPRPEAGTMPPAPKAAAAGENSGSEAAPNGAASIEPFSETDRRDGIIPQPAGFVSRAVALVIDAVIVTVAAAVSGYMISATLAAFGPSILGDYFLAAPALLDVVLFPIYFVFCWTVFGRTVGMAFIGLEVIKLRGTQVSFPRAVLRLAGYLISAALVFVGFLWVLIDDRRMGWLDHIARTQVVSAFPAAGRATPGRQRRAGAGHP